MTHIDPQSYEEMIDVLQSFVSQVSEQCEAMETAGNTCVANTEGDSAAEKSNAKLQRCISNIMSATESVRGVIAALQEELEDAIKAQSLADDLD